MKKIILASAVIAAVLGVLSGLLAGYIYTRNCEVDYKGRARLDYNWKYYFTACPKEEYRYDGKYFSFSYPKFEEKSPLLEDADINGGMVIDTYHRMYLRWKEKEGKDIKSELAGYLSSPDGQATPSIEFMRWLVGTGPKVPVYIERVQLKGGGSAVIISGWGKEHGYVPGLVGFLGHSFIYIAGLTPGGTIFKAEIYAPINMPEDIYRERMAGLPHERYRYWTPERNAENACVLARFLKTFEIKKWGLLRFEWVNHRG